MENKKSKKSGTVAGAAGSLPESSSNREKTVYNAKFSGPYPESSHETQASIEPKSNKKKKK